MPGTVISSRGGGAVGEHLQQAAGVPLADDRAAVGQQHQPGRHVQAGGDDVGVAAVLDPTPGSAGWPGTRRLRGRRADLRAGRPRGAGGTGRPARSRRRRSRSGARRRAGRRAAGTPARPPAAAPGSQYVRCLGGRLQSVPVPQPDPGTRRDRCTCWCPRRAIAAAVEALSPARPRPPGRRRGRAAGRRGRRGPGLGAAQRGRRASRQRLPRRRCPGCGWCSCSAPARSGSSAGCPRACVLCNARGAHTPSTAEWAVTATLAAQRGIPFFVREQDGRPLVVQRPTRSLVGARVLVVGAGDIGRTIGRMLAGFDVELTYVARTARDGVRSTASCPELLPHADVVDPRRPGDPGDHRHGRRRLPRRDGRRRAAGQRRARRRRRHRRAARRAAPRAGCGPPWT